MPNILLLGVLLIYLKCYIILQYNRNHLIPESSDSIEMRKRLI